MKHDHRSIVTALLLIVTVIGFGWVVFLVAFGVRVIQMFHVAAPSSPRYDKLLADVCRDSQKLLCFAVIPLAVMTLLWLFAFLSERRKSKNLIRQLRQQDDGQLSSESVLSDEVSS